jgi:carbon starvation protein
LNSVFLALFAFVGYILAYRFYSKFISEKIFALDPNFKTPAHEFEDNRDFVPTKKYILFGHHYASIAGAAPIVGPAIAVFWGWLPALLWVVFGSILIGGVHDLSALVLSARHQGRSIGDLTEEIVGPRARTLFLLIIFLTLLIIIAVFALVIGVLFIKYPASVLPIWFEVPLAMAIGYMFYRKKGNIHIPSLIALVLMYISIYVGTFLPFKMPALVLGSALVTWVVVLLIYAYFASTLPVWFLLQPRDYINTHQLVFALAVLYLALFIGHPMVVAPAINPNPIGAPPIIPLLFVTIACGAISGFHSLVSSGTTSKQLEKETDARPIGYGGMLFEGVLSTMAIIACTAGFSSMAAWKGHYASWGAAAGLGAKVTAFVEGGAYFVQVLYIPKELALAFVAVVLISFAATTLDTATRIQRYVVQELAKDYDIKFFQRYHPATMVAVITAFLLSVPGYGKGYGKGGLVLWPLFGTLNQLLAGLALLVTSIYLAKKAKPVIYTLVPMIFMLIMTGWAMLINLQSYIAGGKWLVAVIGIITIILEIWLVLEAIYAFRVFKKGEMPAVEPTE